jgi:hypothetical protein
MAGDVTEKGPAWSLLDTKVLIVEGETPAIVPVDLFYVRQVAPDPQITTITFEGDDTSQQVDQLARVEVAVTCSKQDLDAVQHIFGKVRETTIPGEAWSLWMGDLAEVAGVAAGLQYDIAFKDESVTPHVSGVLRYTYPRGTVKLVRPQNAEYQAVHQLVLNFSFERTSVDLLGVALVGVPENGAIYRVAELT